MDWLNSLPAVKGINKVVAEMAQVLMKGPVTFKSPFWDGDITIKDLNDYRAWARFADRIENERSAEGRALEIWEEEMKWKLVGDGDEDFS